MHFSPRSTRVRRRGPHPGQICHSESKLSISSVERLQELLEVLAFDKLSKPAWNILTISLAGQLQRLFSLQAESRACCIDAPTTFSLRSLLEVEVVGAGCTVDVEEAPVATTKRKNHHIEGLILSITTQTCSSRDSGNSDLPYSVSTSGACNQKKPRTEVAKPTVIASPQAPLE
jgi:hypothetical protein